jgi:hypothetical protein
VDVDEFRVGFLPTVTVTLAVVVLADVAGFDPEADLIARGMGQAAALEALQQDVLLDAGDDGS